MSDKCYCGEKFRADGYCKYRCDPALKPSVLRKQRTEAKQRAERARVDSEQVKLSDAERQRVVTALAKIDPIYAESRKRASTASWGRHAAWVGARRRMQARKSRGDQ